MTDQTTAQPLTDQQLDEIDARRQAASKGPWTLAYAYCDCSEDCGHGLYVSRIDTGAGPATELLDLPRAEWELMVHAREDVDALVAEIRRLRAELRIGAPWKCDVCGKGNTRDVCVICETDRPDPAPAAVVVAGDSGTGQ